MGSSKKQTVGYHYKYLLHYGICRAPIDAFLEFRGGDRTAWSGVATSSSTITINAPNLWGGEKNEGGIVGDVDLMFGEATQMPNPWLIANQGPEQTAYRGKFTWLFKGGRFGINPYPKSVAFKFRRILKGWDDDVCWYPEKAPIQVGVTKAPVAGTWPWKVRPANYFVIGAAQEIGGTYVGFQGWWDGLIDSFRITKGVARYNQQTYTVPTAAFGDASTDPYYGNVQLLLRFLGANNSTSFTDDKGHAITSHGGAKITTANYKFGGSAGFFDGTDDWLEATMDDDNDLGTGPWTMDAWVWLDAYNTSGYARALFGYGALNQGAQDTAWYLTGTSWRYDQLEIGSISEPAVHQNTGPYMELGRWAFVSICFDGAAYWLHMDGKLLTGASSVLGMNPAHLLIDSLTAQDMQGEPWDNINEESFTVAADKLYDEAFGLITTYNHQAETTEQFQERICNVIGASLSQSRIDGKYRMDLIRGEYELDDLPILTDADILEYEREPTNPNDSVNEVVVEWFDPIKKEKRSTTPVQSLGAIQAAGATISETAKYPEIPYEDLALRVAARDLKSKSSPLSRFKLITTRKPFGWRSGTFFRLQVPRRGITDMVCIVGELSAGTLRSGAMTMVAVQDVTGMPLTTYVTPEPGVDTEPNIQPDPVPAQALFEAPYVELAGTLPTADLDALPEEAGYLIATAMQPDDEVNYTLFTKAAGEEYAEQGEGDWCPTGLVVEASTIDPSEVNFTVESGRYLDRVTIGTAAMWGSEMVRVDALDVTTGAATFGRGCGDTVHQVHAAGERIWFYDEWGSTDQREYFDSEVVSAKMLSNTTSQQLDIALAPESTITMDQRAARPYPPAGLLVNGVLEPPALSGLVTLTWHHRDRLLQGNQLIDDQVSDIGPEPGTTYNVRWYVNDVLIHTITGVAGNTTSYTPVGAGVLRIEVESERDGLASWQFQVRSSSIGDPLWTEDGDLIATEDDQPLLME